MLRFLDAGESHGKGLVAIIEGFPSNVEIDINRVNLQLARRQRGYGRGERMKIEYDQVEILSGIRGGKTTGSPISMLIYNKDYKNWMDIMDIQKEYTGKITVPRPGHADLNGILKYNLNDIRNVIERASARETAIRTAIGAICMELLNKFDVKIVSRVLRIGKVEDLSRVDMSAEENIKRIEESQIRCFDAKIEKRMIEEIELAKEKGETLGGEVEVIAYNIPCGLGSYSSYDRRMDYIISGAIMSIQAVKAMEFGEGIMASCSYGSEVNDEIIVENDYYKRSTNYAGGIEGGITNGMPVVIKVYMKPIPTTRKGIKTVKLNGEEAISRYERSDTCAVPSLGVVCENILAFEITKEFLNKFGGDSIEDIRNSYDFYLKRISRR
ncbi:chorismate synthase [Fervidicella metallireducens AeB]|uniref:Chorismate synthase n=1 Tax=Fervidicella metallireducens AeB TaxID=1403537 RepID=A0A017RZ46_9CLOT|nr:chorismate synthase [Fervidicella metallireducens]EYE89210.1 chorismate synthase [Fervidicella metallireducens AeB]